MHKKIDGMSGMHGRSKNMLSRRVLAGTRRWATVLLTIAAWIVLSNHCALGLIGAMLGSDSAAGECPMHSAPAKDKPAANIPCCKDLRAIAPHAVKNITAVAGQPVGMRNYVTAIFLAPPRRTTQLLALETGPPPSISFAESILQRSLLAHAPPAVLARS
jgi:hypothetical protein